VRHKNLQQIISECVSKCLRKYLNENVNINEVRQQANQTDKGFERWKKVFDSYLSEMVNELQTDYLNNLDLTINISSDYVFNGGKSRWLAAYERRSRKIANGYVQNAVNVSTGTLMLRLTSRKLHSTNRTLSGSNEK
jgi:hypothetical protein